VLDGSSKVYVASQAWLSSKLVSAE